jgi:hypothetical protein
MGGFRMGKGKERKGRETASNLYAFRWPIFPSMGIPQQDPNKSAISRGVGEQTFLGNASQSSQIAGKLGELC